MTVHKYDKSKNTVLNKRKFKIVKSPRTVFVEHRNFSSLIKSIKGNINMKNNFVTPNNFQRPISCISVFNSVIRDKITQLKNYRSVPFEQSVLLIKQNFMSHVRSVGKCLNLQICWNCICKSKIFRFYRLCYESFPPIPELHSKLTC